jgi:deazaflavin-dependent oxidoreductase (nitroreductase family)
MDLMATPTWRSLPTGPLRWFFRAPILAYRARLGWLFGHRLVLVEHRGRKTGLRRRVVVEVAARDHDSGAVVVASGFGPKANWYRNVLAHPDTTIVLGARRVAVHAVPLSSEEGGEVMVDYARRHAASAKVLAGYMGMPVDGSEKAYRELGRVLPFVRFEPRGHATGRFG